MVEERRDAKPYMLELFSDSGWASCKVSTAISDHRLQYFRRGFVWILPVPRHSSLVLDQLNTKTLSKERREFLMKRIVLQSDMFEADGDEAFHGRKKQLVKLLVNMIMASNLQGCDVGDHDFRTMSWSWKFAMGVIFSLLMLVVRLFLKLTSKMEELAKYKEVLKTVREAAHLERDDDPLCCDLCGGDFLEEDAEEEQHNGDGDETLSEASFAVHDGRGERCGGMDQHPLWLCLRCWK